MCERGWTFVKFVPKILPSSVIFHVRVSVGLHLQRGGALVRQALDQVVLCFRQQLLRLPASLWQRDGSIPKVVQDGPKVFPTAVNQDPAYR